MDVIQPKKANGLAVVSIVSGGWKSTHAGIGSGKPFIDRGYTVFYVVHGSQPRFIVEEIVEDIHHAVRYIRCNAKKFNINPNKLGITGSSAGGHLSLMIATTGGFKNGAAKDATGCTNSSVQAAAVFYPPTDYLNWSAEGDVAVGVGKLAAFSAAFGPGSLTAEGRDSLGHKLSPIYHVNSKQPPVLIIHGDADRDVPIFQAYQFQKKCKEAGVICELQVVKAGGHGGWPDVKKQQELLVDFFDKHLKNK
jgi:acetyl esterase/lipase